MDGVHVPSFTPRDKQRQFSKGLLNDVKRPPLDFEKHPRNVLSDDTKTQKGKAIHEQHHYDQRSVTGYVDPVCQRPNDNIDTVDQCQQCAQETEIAADPQWDVGKGHDPLQGKIPQGT